MKKIDIFLARHGLQMDDLHCGEGRTNARQLLGAVYHQKDFESMSNADFIQVLKEASRGIDSPGRGMLVNPIAADLPLTDFDPYIRGIVRWMNALGIYSRGSCDGHGRRPACIYLANYLTAKQIELIKAACPRGVRSQIDGKSLSSVTKENGKNC